MLVSYTGFIPGNTHLSLWGDQMAETAPYIRIGSVSLEKTNIFSGSYWQSQEMHLDGVHLGYGPVIAVRGR